MTVGLGIHGLVCLGVSIGYCVSLCVLVTVLSALTKAPKEAETFVEKKELYKKERNNTVANKTLRCTRLSIRRATE